VTVRELRATWADTGREIPDPPHLTTAAQVAAIAWLLSTDTEDA